MAEARKQTAADIRKQQRDLNDLRAAREAEDLRAVMGTVEGRRLVWGWLSESGVFRTSYTPNSDQTVFNEGQRNLGIGLFARIQMHCPELYNTMQREAAKRSQDDRALNEDLARRLGELGEDD